MADGLTSAMTNRSLRAIKTELEFLVDANVITSQQYDTIINQLPLSAAARAHQPAAHAAPIQQMANLSVKKEEPVSEKNQSVGYYGSAAVNTPPPAYPTPPVAPAALAYASAMYQYNAQDAGDLALMPNDKVVVTEYMNNEWWKGKNERTGQEGIFPASYVRREEKALQPMMSPAPAPSNYGNVPYDVSQGAQAQHNEPARVPGKGEEAGKKFGKKLGNAAVFGAGATIGSKIVNGIF